MKKIRESRGWTLRELSARARVDYTTLSRVETGKRPPTEKLAEACDRVFPELHGWFMEFYDSSRTWMPAGFRDWPEIENRAASLRVWSPGVVDGLLQTEAYTTAMLRTFPGITAEVIKARLANRMERQRRVLYRSDPPAVEHPAGASELILAGSSAAYVEHMVNGAVFTDDQTVSMLSGMFRTIVAECYRASESRARLERMTERWTGARAATAKPTAERA